MCTVFIYLQHNLKYVMPLTNIFPDAKKRLKILHWEVIWEIS